MCPRGLCVPKGTETLSLALSRQLTVGAFTVPCAGVPPHPRVRRAGLTFITRGREAVLVPLTENRLLHPLNCVDAFNQH